MNGYTIEDGTARVLIGKGVEDYLLFLKIKSLPRYRFSGHMAEFPEEYLSTLGMARPAPPCAEYAPSVFKNGKRIFDYQGGISSLAIRKRRFALFVQCGLGKTLCITEYARHVAALMPGRRVLIVSPLQVCRQTAREYASFYGEPLEIVRAAGLQAWLNGHGGGVGITNYDAISEDLRRGNLGALILDESSVLKSHYGAWGTRLIEMGRGLEWKLCATGTPAPNDRIEYANHAVFLDQSPTVNAFLAKYFVNRGQTGERWELKPHALRPFYRDLSHWCIFLENPATYGWKDNTDSIPPIHVHIHDVPLTDAQQDRVAKLSGSLFGDIPGGMVKRGKLAQLAKGHVDGEDIPTNKVTYIRDLIETWRHDEQTLVWCRYNKEQDALAAALPGSASITGDTGEDERELILQSFLDGDVRTLVSKPRLLGFGLNLQCCTRQVFSTVQDSYEEYHQAVKRSNRIGSSKPLNVHLPVSAVEKPMMENVLRKASNVAKDTAEQEALFREYGITL